MSRGRPRRLGARIGFVLVFSVVLLEVVLQVGAVVVWMTHGSGSFDSDGRPRVLCVGDSFTFGIGASQSDNSYPATMRRVLLREQDLDVQVLNQGRPGRNSRDVLVRLTKQLGEVSPDVVCVLVGTNDGWSHPDPVAESELGATGELQWRWRTWRLFKWFLQERPDVDAGGGTAKPEAQRRKVKQPGPWRLPEWARRPDRPRDPPIEPEHRELQRRVERLIRAQKPLEALDAVAAVRPEAPGNEGDLIALEIRALIDLGRRKEAMEHLDLLAGQYRAAPTSSVVRGTVIALNLIGQAETLVTFCHAVKDTHPHIVEVWWHLGRQYLVQGRHAPAEFALLRAVELVGDAAPRWRANMLGSLARAVAAHDPRRALELGVEAVLEGADFGDILIDMRSCRQFVTPEMARELMDTYPFASAEDEGVVGRLIDETWGQESEEYLAVLDRHLVRIVELVRASGARAVLLCYPSSRMFGQKVAQTQRGVAERMGVPFIEVGQRFHEEMNERGRTREDLFAGDNHCNDAGYAIMAEMAAVVVGRLLRDR